MYFITAFDKCNATFNPKRLVSTCLTLTHESKQAKTKIGSPQTCRLDGA